MNATAVAFGDTLAYAHGDRVELNDHGDHIIAGTVETTIGGLFRDAAVEVLWDHLGYTNWENPENLRPIGWIAG